MVGSRHTGLFRHRHLPRLTVRCLSDTYKHTSHGYAHRHSQDTPETILHDAVSHYGITHKPRPRKILASANHRNAQLCHQGCHAGQCGTDMAGDKRGTVPVRREQHQGLLSDRNRIATYLKIQPRRPDTRIYHARHRVPATQYPIPVRQGKREIRGAPRRIKMDKRREGLQTPGSCSQRPVEGNHRLSRLPRGRPHLHAPLRPRQQPVGGNQQRIVAHHATSFFF